LRARLIEQLQRAARRRLPREVYDTIEGGAGGEAALRRNRQALERATITPRVLTDVSDATAEATILGRAARLPIIIAPTGMNGFYWPRGELEIAHAATAAGIIQTVSAFASVRLEEIAAVGPARRWFQMYPLRNRSVTEDLLQRARASGYEALCVTVDAPAVAMRNRDVRNRVELPPRLNARLLASVLTKPAWALPFALGYKPRFENLAGYNVAQERDIRGLATPPLDPAFAWADLEQVAKQWNGPVIVKGVMHPEDARRAHEVGVNAIVVSNHGGRQFEPAPAALDALIEIRAKAPPGLELYVDGGVMSGADVLIYLNAGAKACFVGRAVLYGLAAAGREGAAAAIEILAADLRTNLMVAGLKGVPGAD
jgi:isopentenyl diphosphate isomerase/L-lactate dehydrogenase-like FMN-dependent dehydrogenase